MEILTESELKAAECCALFDLVLNGVLQLEQIPREHRLIHRNVYIAAFRRAKEGWTKKKFIETQSVLTIWKADIQHMAHGLYRSWLMESYEARKQLFETFMSERNQ